MRIRDPGSRDGDSSDPGSGMEKSRIRDPGSATLETWNIIFGRYRTWYCKQLKETLHAILVTNSSLRTISHTIYHKLVHPPPPLSEQNM
jgi:hypothetical protein